MAQLRVIVAAASVSALVSAAPAPKGWAADPELAAAAAVAAGDPKAAIIVTASQAWSDPVRGCYALALDLHGAAGPIDVAAEQLLTALGTEVAGTKLHDVVKPVVGERGTLALGFDAQRGYHGKLRADLAKTGDVHALACVWNQREPKVCEVACTKWFGDGS
ncbi:MAG: hypothetical protein ABJE66_39185 [Deltaproteobacteria bacterium]